MVHGLPPPTLETFYSPACVPCRIELPVLAGLIEVNGVRVRIVLLDREERARDDIRKISLKLEKLAVPSAGLSPREVLLLAGDTDGILPFARSVSPSGRTCATWRGGLTTLRAKALLSACRVTAPNSH